MTDSALDAPFVERRSAARRHRDRMKTRWFFRGLKCVLGAPGLVPTDTLPLHSREHTEPQVLPSADADQALGSNHDIEFSSDLQLDHVPNVGAFPDLQLDHDSVSNEVVLNPDLELQCKTREAQKTEGDDPDAQWQVVVDGYKQRGNELLQEGKFYDAVLAYTDALNSTEKLTVQSTMFLSSLRSNRAFAYLKLQEWDNVLTDCTAALKLNTSNIKARYRRALAFYEQGHLESAWEDLLKLELLAADSDYIGDVHKLQRKVSIKQGEPFPEIKLAYDVQALEYTKMQGNSSCSEGDYEKALKFYSKGIWLASKVRNAPLHLCSLLHSNKAYAELKMHHWSLAEADCYDALDIDSTNRKARYRLAEALFRQNKLEAAGTELAHFINESPADVCHIDAVKLFWDIQSRLTM
eukprot:TRINITY_DN14246_c0_g1_i2.p1 TRINITY_DN14246_c0_g1~~TRINITY_DN14246_c0_g1_i2.p1  ORF type:complete len:409 (-),score=50.86 TRINITY_DN14246_c0_g1_i2:349-1575(-)